MYGYVCVGMENFKGKIEHSDFFRHPQVTKHFDRVSILLYRREDIIPTVGG